MVSLAQSILVKLDKDKHEIPVSPDSRFIQGAIDGIADAAEKFKLHSFERTALAQALLILVQIPLAERAEAFQRNMYVIKSQGNVYGVLFTDPRTTTPMNVHTYQARLRSPDESALQRATVEFVSAMSPVASSGRTRTISSRSASVTRRGAGSPISTRFDEVEIRSVTNELILRGRVIPVRGQLSLAWHAITRSSGKVLLILSALLIALSALLYWKAPAEGWWHWAEQLSGRLATGAFGALLVEGAIDYSALREAVSGGGAFTSGALIEWQHA